MFDLLSTIPKSFSDKSEIESINDAEDGDNIVVSGEIGKAVRTKGFRSNFILTVREILVVLVYALFIKL